MPIQTIGISMGYGFPGTYSRNSDCQIFARAVNPSDPNPIIFGDAVFLNSNASVPGGVYSSTQSLQYTVTGTTNSSNQITNLPTVATAFRGGPIVVGMQVVGAGIPAGTTVTAVSANSLTLSAAATASATVPLSFLSALVTTANFVGVAVREVKTTEVYAASTYGLFNTYLPGQSCDALERGSCSALIPVTTNIAPNGQVYLRIGLNTGIPAGVIGGFEAQADGNNTLALPGVRFTTGLFDANNVAEITLLTRNTP